MSVKIMAQVWEHAPCTENCLIVLLALADWANDDGVCWPSVGKLAQKARIDRRSAQRIIRKLQNANLITIEEGGGRSKQHRYRLTQPETAAERRPLENGDIQNSDTGGLKTVTLEAQRATLGAQTATPVSPDPLEEPLEKPSIDPSVVFLNSLKMNPAYDHINIDLEIRRMETWAETNHRRVTRRFVVNWLNRIDPPLNGNGHREIQPPSTIEPRTAEWYIKSFEKGLAVAPNYDVAKDIATIPDVDIRAQVSDWFDRMEARR